MEIKIAIKHTVNTGIISRITPIPELTRVNISPSRLMREKNMFMLNSIEIGIIIGIIGTIKMENVGIIILLRLRPKVAIKSVSLIACDIKISITKSNIVATNCFIASLVRCLCIILIIMYSHA